MKILTILLLSCLSLFAINLTKSGSYVNDKSNNLMWQDTRANVIMLGSQEEGNNYCDNLSLAGFTNWRLPTEDEYKYVIDKTREDGMMINRAFSYVINEGYWTSSRTWRTLGKYGYYFYTKSGTLYYENRSYPKFFRCIRDTN